MGALPAALPALLQRFGRAGQAQRARRVCTRHKGHAQEGRRACPGHGCPLMVGPTTCLQQGGHGQAGTQQPSPGALPPTPPWGFPLPRVSRVQPWDAHRGLASYRDRFGDSREWRRDTCGFSPGQRKPDVDSVHRRA